MDASQGDPAAVNQDRIDLDPEANTKAAITPPTLLTATDADSAGAPDAAAPPSREAWRTCAMLSVAVLMCMSTWLSASVVLGYLGDRYGLGPSDLASLTIAVQAGFIISCCAQAATQLPDRVNCRHLMAVGGVIAAAANTAMLACDTLAPALAARFVTGVALALIYPPATKVLPLEREEREVNKPPPPCSLLSLSRFPRLRGIAPRWRGKRRFSPLHTSEGDGRATPTPPPPFTSLSLSCSSHDAPGDRDVVRREARARDGLPRRRDLAGQRAAEPDKGMARRRGVGALGVAPRLRACSRLAAGVRRLLPSTIHGRRAAASCVRAPRRRRTAVTSVQSLGVAPRLRASARLAAGARPFLPFVGKMRPQFLRRATSSIGTAHARDDRDHARWRGAPSARRARRAVPVSARRQVRARQPAQGATRASSPELERGESGGITIYGGTTLQRRSGARDGRAFDKPLPPPRHRRRRAREECEMSFVSRGVLNHHDRRRVPVSCWQRRAARSRATGAPCSRCSATLGTCGSCMASGRGCRRTSRRRWAFDSYS